MTARTVTIGLPWQTFGHGNLGVDALTRSNIEILRSACARCNIKPHFVLLGETSPVAPDTADVEQGPRLRLKSLILGRSEYLSAVRRCDILFDTSEGDSFADIYGPRRFFWQALTKVMVILSRRPLVLSPQTYGPFKAAWVRSVAGWIIKRARSNYPRDALSTGAIEDLRVRANLTEVMDVAFRLPFTPAPRPEGGLLRVGINVSGLMFDPHGQSAATQFSLDYVDYTRKLVATLSGQGAEIWLVSHVVGGSEDDPDDFNAARKLQADFPALKIADRFRSASEAKSFIASMDFFVGGRMHACIGAFSAGVPVVPVAYSRKFTGLFGSIGYDRLVDAHSMTVEQAMEITLAAFHARDRVRQEIVPALALAKSRVDKYEDEITALLDEVASRRSNSGTRP